MAFYLVITACLVTSLGPNGPIETFYKCTTSFSEQMIFSNYNNCAEAIKKSASTFSDRSIFMYCVPTEALQKELARIQGEPI